MCADPVCVKENRAANEDEVHRIVSEVQIQRWKLLRRRRALEKDPGLVYCPIPVCQGPCPKAANQPDISSVDDMVMRRQCLSLRTCDFCGFSFCILCKRAWHGLEACSSNVTAKALGLYMELNDGHPDKLGLQRRFGKALLEKLVTKLQKDAEERAILQKEVEEEVKKPKVAG